jgi:hypothetical protein
MSETLSFREVKLEGGWLMVKPEREDMGKAMAIVRKHKDRVYDLEVKEHRKKRSLDANAMAWKLLGELSAVMRIPSREIYREYIMDVGGNFEIVPIKAEHIEEWNRVWCSGHEGRSTEDLGECRNTPGYHNIKCYISSSDFDVHQMSRLLDLIIQDCKQVGIEVMSERERSLLLEEWGGNQ